MFPRRPVHRSRYLQVVVVSPRARNEVVILIVIYSRDGSRCYYYYHCCVYIKFFYLFVIGMRIIANTIIQCRTSWRALSFLCDNVCAYVCVCVCVMVVQNIGSFVDGEEKKVNCRTHCHIIIM